MAATTTKSKHTSRRHIAVIPCRWGASRFPAKPLAMLGDKPMLWHVHQRCQEATRLDDAIVATDDPRIQETCRKLSIRCVMTGEHATGTDRVAECAQHLDADAYINVQGDEPFIDPAAVDAVSEAVAHLDTTTPAVNAYTRVTDAAAAIDHNVVKVVVSADNNALMFSRQPIPYPRGRYPATSVSLGCTRSQPKGWRYSGNSARGRSNAPRVSRCCASSSIHATCRCCPWLTPALQWTPPRTSSVRASFWNTHKPAPAPPEGARKWRLAGFQPFRSRCGPCNPGHCLAFGCTAAALTTHRRLPEPKDLSFRPNVSRPAATGR